MLNRNKTKSIKTNALNLKLQIMKKKITDYFGRLLQKSTANLKASFEPLISRKKLVLLPCVLLITINLFSVNLSFAQQSNITLKGIVVDNNDREAIAGISIIDSNKKSLGVTGMDVLHLIFQKELR
jgi:hypothetical protein